MKVLAPAVTIILTSHMKPLVAEALDSIFAQTRRDYEVIVADSGQWIGREDALSREMAAAHWRYSRHPLVEWVTTGEPPDLIAHRCPVAWATNEVIRAGLVRGRYVCTFYDDDAYYPTFIEKMAGFLDANPDRGAILCAQDRLAWAGDGWRSAGRLGHGELGPGQFDNRVDGGQIMFRRTVLDAIGDPWLPEEPADGSCRHSDGIFLEKVARACGTVPALPDVLCANRKTPLSRYSPT